MTGSYALRVLHDVSDGGGFGSGHPALPGLFRRGYYGPLVVAVDSNILVDLRERGNDVLGNGMRVTEPRYAEELPCLGTLMNHWMLRDIRIAAPPRAQTDAKHDLSGFDGLIDGLAEALECQYGDWTFPAPSHGHRLLPVGDEDGPPDRADRDVVLEAQAACAHVFVTRDGGVRRRAALTGPLMRTSSPSGLIDGLSRSRVGPIGAGLCGEPECQYTESVILAPGMGKWGPLVACSQED